MKKTTLTNKKVYQDFYAVAGIYGNNPKMRDRLATKWMQKYQETCGDDENKQLQFWLALDETECVHIAFKLVAKVA